MGSLGLGRNTTLGFHAEWHARRDPLYPLGKIQTAELHLNVRSTMNNRFRISMAQKSAGDILTMQRNIFKNYFCCLPEIQI